MNTNSKTGRVSVLTCVELKHYNCGICDKTLASSANNKPLYL